MAPIHLLAEAMLALSFVVSASARHGDVHDHQNLHHRHEAVEVGKRQLYPPLGRPPSHPHPPRTTSAASVLAYIIPSPGAKPVAVTKESQIVASFVAQFTLCELPPLEFFPITRLPSAGISASAPYHNYSISTPPGNGSCTTIYSPTITMVCSTTLTALAEMYTVTNCAQDITFSTEYGYVLYTPTPSPSPSAAFTSSFVPVLTGSGTSGVPISSINNTLPSGTGIVQRALPSEAAPTITPGPTIEKLTTYYLAPWQQLTAGTAPQEVDLKVCRTFASNDTTECIREYQVWSTSLVTETATSVTTVNISTTIHGRSQLIVETFVANVTELLTTFSMSTTMALEYQTEWTTTHSSARPKSTSTGPTVYETLKLEQASQTAASSSADSTMTTTIQLTSTLYAGTTTITLKSSSSAPSATASADFASMLGIGARWLRAHLV